MSVHASEMHAAAAASFGQWELTIFTNRLLLREGCSLAVPLPHWSGSERQVWGCTEERLQPSECWERSSQLSLCGNLKCKSKECFVLQHCQSSTAHCNCLHWELFLWAFFPACTSPKYFWHLQQGSSKSPSWDHTPFEGRILQQVVKD